MANKGFAFVVYDEIEDVLHIYYSHNVIEVWAELNSFLNSGTNETYKFGETEGNFVSMVLKLKDQHISARNKYEQLVPLIKDAYRTGRMRSWKFTDEEV